MATSSLLSGYQILLPKKKAKPGGTSYTETYRPGTPAVTAPGYREHLEDLFNTRIVNDSRELIEGLARHDPDISAVMFAYGSIASSSKLVIEAYDLAGVISTEGINLANAILERVFNVNDYTLGFSGKLSSHEFLDEMRYMTLLRGGSAMELVLNKQLEPDQFRIVDMASLTWNETAPGVYKPFQNTAGTQGDGISLDIPTFFTTRFHQNSNDIYTYSPFVSAINSIAARTTVIAELYRIMQVTGYPRLDITILEDIIMASAPPTLRQDPKKRQQYVGEQIQAIRSTFSSIRSDQPFIHTNAVEAKMINDKNPGAAVDISAVIDILDAQNTAALKAMPSVVGKSNNGQVASTEARLFAMNCDSLNRVISVPIQAALTLGARLAGFQGSIRVSFTPVELRPVMELEAQLTMRQARLQTDLSLGLITDDEYHMAMYQRPRPDTAPELAGTGFKPGVDANAQAELDAAGQIAKSQDTLGRSQSGEGADGVRSKAVKN